MGQKNGCIMEDNTMRQIIRSSALLALLALLCGCSGLRLYSETRDKQGAALKKSYGEAKVESVIAAQRDNNAALLQEQLAAQEQVSKASRDQKIRAMITSTSGTVDDLLVTPLANEVKTLAGSEDALAQWQLNQRYDADYASRREDEAREFQRFGFELPSCADLQGGKASAALAGWIATRQGTTGGFVSGTLQRAKSTCDDYKKGQAPLPDPTKARVLLGGRLATVATSVASDEEELERIRTKSLAARNAYRAALGEYDAAVADAGKGDPEARKNVQQLATKLKDNLKLVMDADDAFGIQFLAQEKRDSLTAFLAAVAGTKSGEDPPAGSSRAAMALILVPDAIDNARQSLADAKKPLLVPLLMRKNHEQLNLEAANRDIAAQELIVVLARARLDAMTDQAIAAKDALDTLKPIGSVAKNAKFGEVGKLQSVEERQRIFQALALHFDAEGRLAAEVKKYDYKRSAALQERQLSLAEVNVLQWNSLIGTSVDQLADFGTTGIKAEHILALINSLTLLWIGMGVN
jgi:hypothetical protein